MGSPDIRQINGIGGATPQTSKVAIVSPADVEWADVDYLFAQVQIAQPLIDWGGNCGNISAAVGPFAVDSGIVKADDGLASVRIRNVNTGKLIVSRFPVLNGRAVVAGDYTIAGVPTPGARTDVAFIDPAGTLGQGGGLFPTGVARQYLTLPDGRSIEASVVDAGNPTVFIRATDFGLTGTETPDQIALDERVVDEVEYVRALVAVELGLAPTPGDATVHSPGLPKIALVGQPADQVTLEGVNIDADDIDLSIRSMSMGRPHRAVQITVTIATAAAAVSPGTLVAELVRNNRPEPGQIRLGHGFGTTTATVEATPSPTGPPDIASISVARTVRAIIDGVVHVPRELAV